MVAGGGSEQARQPLSGARWTALSTLRDALPDLPSETLLHAGPPFVGTPPPPVLNSAAQALVFEGAAADLASARRLVESGKVRLLPAQDFGVATPLAQVVSASMPVFVVGEGAARGVAPLVEGPPPALRFGATDAGCLDRLRKVAELARQLAPFVREHPIALDRIVAGALERGDECHARVGEANALLAEALSGAPPEAVEGVAGNPGFVLPLLMAASVWKLRSAAGPLAGAGGNGVQFGVKLRARGWVTASASPPQGPRFPGKEGATALGAIGDSAVIDICGLGGQALSSAPTLLSEWASYLPADAKGRRTILDPATCIVDPGRVRKHGIAPIIDLAILDAAGEAGLVGRGAYVTPIELFAEARA